jgi:hypothetical protein
MRLGSVVCVVLPASTLLNTDSSPLCLSENAILWNRLREVFWQYYMAVFELLVQILLRVVNLLSRNTERTD